MILELQRDKDTIRCAQLGAIVKTTETNLDGVFGYWAQFFLWHGTHCLMAVMGASKKICDKKTKTTGFTMLLDCKKITEWS